MDPGRDRLKHLLIILLEALSGSQDGSAPNRTRIQEKAEAAGLDEDDVHGLLDWIESHWQPDGGVSWSRDPVPDAPSDKAFRVFGEADAEYLSPSGLGFLMELFNAGQVNRAQFEALLQYASFIAIKPLDPYDLETVLEQVLFRPGRPDMTGGASEGMENIH
jgi:uncharacterized protein Smg (DUF494 family)